MVKPVGLLTAPTGKATGAKNVRVNQPVEKSPIKNEWQVWVRPWTATKLKTNAEVQLAKETARKEQITAIEKELNTNLLSKYNPDKPKATRTFIETKLSQWKITREEGIEIVEKLYDNANWFDKPHYEKILEDLYSNKKIESFDDLLNEKQVQKELKTPRQEFLETPEGIYEEINKKANDRRFNPEKANALIAKFKEKTGIDLMKNPMQKFDEKGNVVRTIVKPNTIKNESKVNNTQSGDTIPEGYFKNAFWEIQKNPSNKKWGFIKIPEIGKKVDIETNNFENFTSKFKSFEEFKNAVKVIDSRDISNREWNRITRMVWTKNWEFDSLDSFIENYSSEFPYWRSWFEKNSVNAIKKAMNDEYITVYRALPKWKSIEWWDWIALTKEYAEAHLWNMEKWNWVIISIKVPKKDVFNAYTDPNEWLYAPQNKLNWINSLEDFYKQYSNKPKIIVKPESKSIVKNPLVEEARKRPKSIIKK